MPQTFSPVASGNEALSSDRVRIVVVLVTTLLVVVVLAYLGYSLWSDRQAKLLDAERSSLRLSQLLEEQMRHTIDAAEAALSGSATVERLLARSGKGREDQMLEFLRERVRALGFLRAIWILDPRGDMIHDSESLPGKYNLADREYFRVHRDKRVDGLYVEGPILSKHGVWFVGLSLRIENADGSFAGVVASALEPRYLQRFFDSLDFGREGAVGLLHTDGSLIARSPAMDGAAGRKFVPRPAFLQEAERQPHGSFRGLSPLDGVARIYSYRSVPGRPLVALVGLGEREVLAPWRRLALVSALAALALVSVIVWLGYFVLGELRRRDALSQALRESARRLQELGRRMMEIEERERRDINREIHDSIGQNLSLLNLNLDQIGSQLSGTAGADATRRLQDAQELLLGTIARVRNVMAGLHPPVLEELGLLSALRSHADTVAANSGVAVEVRGEEATPRPSRAVELCLYRIAQEALANAVKHAGAARIEVALRSVDGDLELEVADDGTGFDAAAVAPTSQGLRIMHERAESAGIRLEIGPGRRSGTRVLARYTRTAP